jgi:signal transduction histidine kinase/CheY-like chemotaxis protein
MNAATANKSSTILDHLGYLRAELITVLALFVAASGYLWLTWNAWPWSGRNLPPTAWIGSLSLIAVAAATYRLRNLYLPVACGLLLIGSQWGVVCAALAYPLIDTHYLFVVPIVLANALAGPRVVIAVSGTSLVLSMVITSTVSPVTLASSEQGFLPYGIIAFVTIVCLLSTRTVYTMLGWLLNAYESAHQNELTLRQQEAEIKQALNALDTTTNKLERANYMMTLALERAEKALQLKQQFAQNISHELRTPLNLIVGFTETMLQSTEYYSSHLSPAFLRDLNIVFRNACHLRDLVDDVLDLARIETAQLGLSLQDTDLAHLVRELVETVRSLVVSRGLELYTRIEPDLPRLTIDPTRIRQVLLNLFKNAIQFTPQGHITINVRRQDDHVIFSVVDTGMGIAAEEIPHIFEAFYQVDATMQRRHGGAGLGLAISQRFVELHSGKIWVTSKMGRGSTFYFSLPVSREMFLESSKHSDFDNEGMATSVVGSLGCIVLLVTRSAYAANTLRRYLRHCRTLVVQSLDQARLVTKQTIPQIIVIDTSCEDFESIRLDDLARNWNLTHTPFVGVPLSSEERLRRQLAVDGYLIKPVTRDGLWDVLRQFGEHIQRVLIIDDDRDFVRLVTRMLETSRRRYQVFCAYDGEEGQMMAQLHRPHLILMDLALPDIKGEDLVERLRASLEPPTVPIVVISEYDELNTPGLISGVMAITIANGILPTEIVRWVQAVLDSTAQDIAVESAALERGVIPSVH